MAFVVRDVTGKPGDGGVGEGKSTRKAAVEAARNLIAQGIEGVTIMNEDGRVYVPAEFDAFLAEDN
ncbi:MAG TPA: hypothetical protein VGO49_07810 [Bradyrhizobium sp.]|jgi:hypothetical protein|nr:hypothetical protein [Bradyrhizobium sp.]